MSEKYVSSIINNYGDVSNMKDDAKKIRDILNRQGDFIFFEVLANHLAEVSVKYKLTHEESARARDKMLNEFKELINERI